MNLFKKEKNNMISDEVETIKYPIILKSLTSSVVQNYGNVVLIEVLYLNKGNFQRKTIDITQDLSKVLHSNEDCIVFTSSKNDNKLKFSHIELTGKI